MLTISERHAFLRPNSGNHTQLDRCTPRQLGDADRCTRVTTAIAQALDQPVGSAVHDLRLLSESRGRGDVSNELQDLDDLVLSTCCVIDGRNAEICAEGCRLLCGGDIDTCADFTGAQQGFAATRQLTTDIRNSTMDDHRQVVATWFVHAAHLDNLPTFLAGVVGGQWQAGSRGSSCALHRGGAR
jgi:hypothetical protein